MKAPVCLPIRFAVFLVLALTGWRGTGHTEDFFGMDAGPPLLLSDEQINLISDKMRDISPEQMRERLWSPEFEAFAPPEPPLAGAEGEWLRVNGVYPLPDLPLRDEIIFYFSEPLDADAPAIPAALELNIPGTWEIRGTHLRFSSPLLRVLNENYYAARISLRINPELRSQSGKRVHPHDIQHHFQFVPPTFKSLKIVRADEQTFLLELDFTKPISSANLSALLDVRTTDGSSVPATLDSPNYASRIPYGHSRVHISLPRTVGLPVIVQLAPGVQWSDGTETLKTPIVGMFPSMPLIDPPDISYSLTGEEEQLVQLRFKEPIQWHGFQQEVTVHIAGTKMPVAYAFEAVNDRNFHLRLRPFPRKNLPQIQVSLSPLLSSDDGQRALGRTVTLAATLAAPSIAGGYSYWQTDIVNGNVFVLELSTQVAPEELLRHLSVTPPVTGLRAETGHHPYYTRIMGDWESEKTYAIRIKAGLKDRDGNRTLTEDLEILSQETPKFEGAEFEDAHLTFFARSDQALPRIRARNILEATVTAYQLFPSNLPFFTSTQEQNGLDAVALDAFAQELGKTAVRFPIQRDRLLTAPIDLKSVLPAERRGVFLLSVGPSQGWQNIHRMLVYTDMGILSHWSDNELAVFVHDLYSLAPYPGATATLYSHKHQVMGTATTDSSGIARFSGLDTGLGVPKLVVAEREGDYSYLDLARRQEDSVPFTPDMPRYNRAGYDAYIYLDRNLYRPGETVHARWLARSSDGVAQAGLPLQVRIANPKGVWIYAAPTLLSDFGTGGVDYATEQAFPTGKYMIEVRAPEAPEPLAFAHFNVEEFVPNRMKVEAAFDCRVLLAQQQAQINVRAEHLFGGAASGRKAELTLLMKPAVFECAAWPGYRFGNDETFEERLEPQGEQTTGEDGIARFPYTFAPAPEMTMPVLLLARARILETGGRPVTGTAKTFAFPDAVIPGIAARAIPERETLEVRVAAITPEESPADIPQLHVTLERMRWDFHIRRFSQRSEPRWSQSYVPLQTWEVPLTAGQGLLEVPYPEYGEYRLRVHADATVMYSTLSFNRWWHRLDVVSTPRQDLVRLSLNQEVYRPGDTIELRIECPYDGQAFVVVQGEEILHEAIVPVTSNEGFLRTTVEPGWFPNAWAQVTVVRRQDQGPGGGYPYSSFSMINVPLDIPERCLDLAFEHVPETMLPQQDLTLVLTAKDSAGSPVEAEITVAAVDEGIHNILSYQNPDPCAWFRRSRQMEQRRSHYYDQVFFDKAETPIGGDAMRRMGITSPVDENWIKPLALWSGAVLTDASGRAQVSFNIPEFVGQLRLVAVASGKSATGTTNASVRVTRPRVLRTSMPRFALPGDRFECLATVMNTTTEPCVARVRWEASGALSGAGESILQLPAGREASCRAALSASGGHGQGLLSWTVTILSEDGATEWETLHERSPIPARPPVAYQTETQSLVLQAGETRVIENAGFVENHAFRMQLHASANPLWRLRSGLGYLLRFPYGCVEQLTSQALPLCLLRDYAPLFEDALEGAVDTETAQRVSESYLRQTITRLLALQTVDGGLGMWPGAARSYPYGSVYALHFLTLARQGHAFEVQEPAFRELQQYAQNIMQQEKAGNASDLFLRAYACYVLALDGQVEAFAFIPRMDNIKVPASARYLLGAAKGLAGAPAEEVMNYLEKAPSAEESGRETSGALHSATRADALKLFALAQAGAPAEKTAPLVDSLLRYLDDPQLYTTQETAFAITALATYLKQTETSLENASAQILDADGAHAISGGEHFKRAHEGPGARYEIRNNGAVPLYVYLESSGIPLAPRTTPIAEGIVVERAFLSETGQKLEGIHFEHGKQYIVQLTLVPEKPVENLLVVDLLPAGFEIANPRLEGDLLPSALTPQRSAEDPEDSDEAPPRISPSFLEIRDDRLAAAFDRLEAEKFLFHYLVRAVTPGQFRLPALHAEGMYEPTVRATTVPGEITIE